MDSDSPICSLSDLQQRWSRTFSFAKDVVIGRRDFSPEDRHFLKQHKGTETLPYENAKQYLAMVRRFCDAPYNRCLCLDQPGHCHARHDKHPVPCPCLLNPSVCSMDQVPEKEEERCLKEVKNWLIGPCVTPFEEERPKIGRLRLKRKIPRPTSEKPQDRWAGLFLPKK